MTSDITASDLDTRKHRASARKAKRLAPRRKPYFVEIGPGLHIGYRCNQGPDGTFLYRKANGSGGNYLRPIGPADDREGLVADNEKIFDYYGAVARARELALGGAGPVSKEKLTVWLAVVRYKDDLVMRGKKIGNATRILHHLKGHSLANMLVGEVGKNDINEFQKMLIAKNSSRTGKTLSRSTVARMMRVFKRALDLAAEDFPRQVVGTPWKLVKALRNTEMSDTVFLTDQQVGVTITESDRRHGVRFGNWVWVHADTGQRTDQINQLDVEDLRDATTDAPWLNMIQSRKGTDKEPERFPVRISVELAERLLRQCRGRGANEPLLLNFKGSRAGDFSKDQTDTGKRKPFNRISEIAKAFNFPLTKQGRVCTIYALRHTSIIRMLRDPRNNPYEVAQYHDTSMDMLRRHYATEMHRAGSDIGGRTLPKVAIGRTAKVIPLRA